MLSPEGQTLFESLGRVPASTRVKSALDNFPLKMIDPATALDEAPKWEKLWNGFLFSTRIASPPLTRLDRDQTCRVWVDGTFETYKGPK